MPISEIFDAGQYKLLSVKIQISILAVNIYLIGQKMGNLYFSISIILIVTIFLLQSITRRFLLVLPRFQWLQFESKTIDTYLLYLLLSSSVILTVAGILYENNIALKQFEDTLNCYLIWIVIGSLSLSLMFLLFGKKIIRHFLSLKMKKMLLKNPFKITIKYQCSKCENNEAILRRTLTDWNLGSEQIICTACHHTLTRKTPLRLGEVVFEDKTINKS